MQISSVIFCAHFSDSKNLGFCPFFLTFVSIVFTASKNGSLPFVDITTPYSCLGLKKAKSRLCVRSNCHFRTTINFSSIAFEVSSPKCMPCFFSVSFITLPQKSSLIDDRNCHLYFEFVYRIFMNFVLDLSHVTKIHLNVTNYFANKGVNHRHRKSEIVWSLDMSGEFHRKLDYTPCYETIYKDIALFLRISSDKINEKRKIDKFSNYILYTQRET